MSERGYKLGHFVEIGDLHWGSQTQFTVAWGDAVLDGLKGWRFGRWTDEKDPELRQDTFVEYTGLSGANSHIYQRSTPSPETCGPALTIRRTTF